MRYRPFRYHGLTAPAVRPPAPLPQVWMLRSYLDHLVVTAPSLAAGVGYVEDALGAPLETGGRHLLMGTHNCLLRLGGELYLEVIAVDPDALVPQRSRWFELGPGHGPEAPRLAAWVARVDDIQRASESVSRRLGPIETMRRGGLEWRITVPSDGSLPFQGIAPMLIQWRNGPHPADRLQDRGCALLRLEGFHPEPEGILALLEAVGFQGPFTVARIGSGEAPSLVAHIRTPQGIRLLNLSGERHG